MRFKIRDWMCCEETGGKLPSLLRRRITPVGQLALQAAWELPGLKDARFVLSSRHGEFSRTLSLLQSIVKNEQLSPADFSLSVHHALIGLLSIATKNGRGHNAVAAGSESFCFGLMESVAYLNENPRQSVVFIHVDDTLPELYSPFRPHFEKPIACAFALEAASEGASFSMHSAPATEPNSYTDHAAQFISFLTGDKADLVSPGENFSWRWTRHD